MIRIALLAWVGLVLSAGSPVSAQMPDTFNPGMVSGTMNPVVTNQCSGGRCADGKAPVRHEQGATREDSRKTCAHARTVTPKPSQKAAHARLMALCGQAGL